jgi:hypothetical protein
MKKECNGNLKDIILEMMKSDTDCCEVTNTVGDTSVTVEVTITKIVDNGEVVYDAYQEDDCLDNYIYEESDGGYVS